MRRMKTVTINITRQMDMLIERVARIKGTTKSRLIREAVRKYVEEVELNGDKIF